jgi:hypothetical protein
MDQLAKIINAVAMRMRLGAKRKRQYAEEIKARSNQRMVRGA